MAQGILLWPAIRAGSLLAILHVVAKEHGLFQ